MPTKNNPESEHLQTEARFVWSVFLFVGAVIICVILYAVYLYTCRRDSCLMFEWQKALRTTSFAECAARGFPVTEAFPRECRVGRNVFFEQAP
jgi:hypothetical protein